MKKIIVTLLCLCVVLIAGAKPKKQVKQNKEQPKTEQTEQTEQTENQSEKSAEASNQTNADEKAHTTDAAGDSDDEEVERDF